jgi:hypothetical protein
MPVRKFRSIEEMNAADDELWLAPGDPSLLPRVTRFFAEWSSWVRLEAPRGVRKYRSAEEAHADRERWEDARIRRIREERVKK